MSEVLTVKEAAALLKTSRQQIRRMIQNGELPAVKVGREDQQERPAGLSGVPVLTGTPIYLAIVSKKEINASFCSLVSLVI